MNIRQKLEYEIKLLEAEKQRDPSNSAIINLKLKGLQEALSREKEHDKKKVKRNLNKEKEKLQVLLNETKDVDEYKELKRQIKKLNQEIREQRNITNYLTNYEFKRLKSEVLKGGKHKEKYWLMLQLAFEGGLRVSEMCGLTIHDINIDNGTMLCRRGKGSNTTTIYLTKETLKKLDDYIKIFNPVEHLFLSSKGTPYTQGSVNKMFKRYCEKAKIPVLKRRFHVLKHTRGVFLAEKGLNLQQIKNFLGHKSIQSTLVYAVFTTSQEESAYELIGGY